MVRKLARLSAAALVGSAAFGVLASSHSQVEPVPRVEAVDLPRFMGRWYVIAQIAPSIVGESYNGEERYMLTDKGRIDTRYSYRDGGFDAKLKHSNSTGFVVEGTNNAEWGMQIMWPIKLEYVISHLDADYQTTIVARSKRDYVWLMSRSPIMDDTRYRQMVARIAALGYDTSALRKEPQQSLEQRQ